MQYIQPSLDAAGTVVATIETPATERTETVAEARYWAVRRSENMRLTRTGVVRRPALGVKLEPDKRKASRVLVYRVDEALINPDLPVTVVQPAEPARTYNPDGHKSDQFFCTGCGHLLRPREVGRCDPCEVGLAEVRP